MSERERSRALIKHHYAAPRSNLLSVSAFKASTVQSVLLMLVLLVAFVGLKQPFLLLLLRRACVDLVCAGGAVLICFAASR